MPNTARLKACGGLAPFSWTIVGPATLGATTGVANTVTCIPASTDPSPVVVTVTDAVGVSVSHIVNGTCACSSCATSLTTTDRGVGNCSQATIHESYVTGGLTAATPLALAYALDCQTLGSLNILATANITLISGVSGTPKGGFSIIKDDSGFAVALNSVNMQYNGAVSGSPISGFAFFVTADSTPCNFTGFVFLVDHKNTRSLFGYYINGDITTTMPTIITSVAELPTNNLITAYVRPGFNPDFGVTNFGGGISFDFGDITGYGISASVNCGMIWVGNSDSGTHSANWTEYTFDNNWTTH